jgi:hypothetical protein
MPKKSLIVTPLTKSISKLDLTVYTVAAYNLEWIKTDFDESGAFQIHQLGNQNIVNITDAIK